MRRYKKNLLLAVFCFLLFWGTGELAGNLQTSLAVREVTVTDTAEEVEKFRSLDVKEELLQSCYNRKKLPWFSCLFPKNTEGGNALYSILADMECFPVSNSNTDQNVTVDFEDSWGGARTYGGERRHEGTDLMPSINERGVIPVVSVSDGTVEKKGWLELGGWRLGIRGRHGTYFYYAHLERYAEGIQPGSEVKAGQIIGYMGDSGYGEEGTVGQFAVHLHFGIYLTLEGKEVSVNPYKLLKLFDEGSH